MTKQIATAYFETVKASQMGLLNFDWSYYK